MLWNILKFLGCQFYICWDNFFKVMIIFTRVKIESIHLLKFIINFTWMTNTSMEAAATPADLAVCSHTKSPEQELHHSLLSWSPKYFKPVLDKTTCGSESIIQVSSREPDSLSSEQVQLYPGVHSSPSSFWNCNTQIHLICLSFQAFQWCYSASFKVYHIIFELAIILFPVLQSPADQGKFAHFPVVTTATCDHLLLDPLRCKKAPTVKAWSLLLSLMGCVILNRAHKWGKLHDR